jgi:sterol desaturase/sphingolipid hydroxylase (fatty acid hydroxylase superfamily)
MLKTSDLLLATACFASAFVLASLLEYWLHRLMHVSQKVGARHLEHHRNNTGQGVLWEFRDYIQGAIVLIAAMFLYSWIAGIGWLLGSFAYAAFSAYAHQLQHENPTKCFWMKMPIHYVHHKYGMWHHNFGLAVDWWDKVFGTYKLVDWLTEEELSQPERNLLQVRWW